MTKKTDLSPQQLLSKLKSIKNELVGNVLEKKAALRNDDLISFLVETLKPIPNVDSVTRDVRCEASIIVSSLCLVGKEALHPLLSHPSLLSSLLFIVQTEQATSTSRPSSQLLSSIKAQENALRALRNIALLLEPPANAGRWGKAVGTTADGVSGGDIDEKEFRNAKLREIGDHSAFITPLLNILLKEQTPPRVLIPLLTLLTTLSAPPSSSLSASEGKQKPPATQTRSQALIKACVDIIEGKRGGDVQVQVAALWFLERLLPFSETEKTYTENAQSLDAIRDIEKLIDVKSDPSIVAAGAACLAAFYSKSPHMLLKKKQPRPTIANLLSTLSRLLDSQGEYQIRACFSLAHLVADDHLLQKACFDSDCLTKLTTIVKEVIAQDEAEKENMEVDVDEAGEIVASNAELYIVGSEVEGRSRLLEGALKALASLSLQLEDSRQALVADQEFLPIIFNALSHPSSGVRTAACQCTRALSRSVNILRTSMVDVSGMAPKLFELVKDEEEEIPVRSEALATICNLLLEFSPLKQELLNDGLIEVLVKISASNPASSNTFRLSAIWGLKNLAYRSAPEVKVELAEKLGWEAMYKLIQDHNQDISEQALTFMRNLYTDNNIDSQTIIDVFGSSQVLASMSRLLVEDVSSPVLEQAVFITTTLSSIIPQDVMSFSDILKGVRAAMNHSSSRIRTGAGLVAVNLISSNSDAQFIKTLLGSYDFAGGLSSVITDFSDTDGSAPSSRYKMSTALAMIMPESKKEMEL